MGNARTIPQTCKGYNVIKCNLHARLIKVGTNDNSQFRRATVYRQHKTREGEEVAKI